MIRLPRRRRLFRLLLLAGEVPVISDVWILATGIWNDGGVWKDGENWKDS